MQLSDKFGGDFENTLGKTVFNVKNPKNVKVVCGGEFLFVENRDGSGCMMRVQDHGASAKGDTNTCFTNVLGHAIATYHATVTVSFSAGDFRTISYDMRRKLDIPMGKIAMEHDVINAVQKFGVSILLVPHHTSDLACVLPNLCTLITGDPYKFTFDPKTDIAVSHIPNHFRGFTSMTRAEMKHIGVL